MTDTSSHAEVVTDQIPRLAEAPAECRLCNVQLSNGQTYRDHVKGAVHVYNLRMKVAEPESAASPPTPPPTHSYTSRPSGASSPPRRKHLHTATVEDEDDDYSEEDTDEDEDSIPEFVPGQCLFCPHESDDLEASLSHMSSSHGFTVPYQDCLAVDLDTVIWYLHFVIQGYQECICCGTQRGTVEAVQQHMMAKGHCRFDITPDTEDFYEMPREDNAMLKAESGTVRLPSGKVIANKKSQEHKEPKMRQTATNPVLEALTAGPPPESTSTRSAKQTPPTASEPDVNTSQEVASRRDQPESNGRQVVRSSEALLAAQLSRLVIAGHGVQMRAEAKKRAKMERKNNKILQKNFRLDAGDSRAGRAFCC